MHRNINLFFILFILILPQMLFGAKQITKTDLSESMWEYRWSDMSPFKQKEGWQAIAFPSNPPKRDGKTNVWYRVLLPEELPTDPMMYIFSIDLIAEVYSQNQMIYSFGSFDEHGQGKFEGWPWHMFKIPKDAAGEYLYFRIYSDYPDIGLWGEVSIASEGEHLKAMLDNDILRIAASAVALFIGVLLLIGFLDKRSKIELFFVGSLFFTQGLDLLLSTKIMQLYFSYPLFERYILAFSYFYIPVGVAGFLEQFIGKKFYSAARRVWQVHVLFIFISFSAALIGFTSVSSLYVYYDYLHYIVTFPILTLLMVYLLMKVSKDEKIVASGLLILLLSWAHSSLISWGFIPWQEHLNYAHTFLCLLLFTYVIARRLSHAGELEEANKNLQKTNTKLQKTQQKLIKLATFDALTGLYNRNKINEYFQSELDIAKRYHESFGIIILDIDDFKKVNDTHGHLVGDEILIHFASLLKTQIRKTDILGRWGGEEFIILCRKASLKDTKDLAQKLRQKIQENAFPSIEHITASFGVSAYQENDTVKSLFEKADKALFKAKKLDKNRVEVSK